MGICDAFVYMGSLHMSSVVPTETRQCADHLSCWGWTGKQCPLQEQYTVLSTVPSLQPQKVAFLIHFQMLLMQLLAWNNSVEKHTA